MPIVEVQYSPRPARICGPHTIATDLTIPALLQAAANQSESPWLMVGDASLSVAEVLDRARRIAHGFRNLGVRRLDRVAISLSNGLNFIDAWFAVSLLGATQVSLNPALKDQERNQILGHSGAKLLITDQPVVEMASTNHSDHALSVVQASGRSDTTPTLDAWRTSEPIVSEFEPPFPDDAAVIIYTSGTTGSPKGVVLSHRALVLAAQATAFGLGATPNDRFMTANPLFHVNAKCYATLASLVTGAELVLLERFSRSRFETQILRYAPTILVLVAATAPMLWHDVNEAAPFHSSLRIVLTGGVPGDMFRAFENHYGVQIVTGYAMTECPIGLMSPLGANVPTPGIGIPLRHPDTHWKNMAMIANPQGGKMPPNQHGEIVIRNDATMTEYFRDPEATRAIKQDGWIRTGDLGYCDENGYFYFLGRIKDLIRRRGEMVSPAAIESVLRTHDKVSDAAVIGIPSKLGHGEEEIVAFAQVSPSTEVAHEELLAWCADHLADFKVPTEIRLVKQFPRTTLGKIKKASLKTEFAKA